MCGVIGVVGTPKACHQVLMGLTLLQHRGQDAAGILTHDDNGFHYVKNLGLVDQVFNPQNLSTLTGSLALGHVRYGTAGKGELSSVQPFLTNYPYGIGMVHNGNLLNYQQLSDDLKNNFRRHPLSHSDTEVILNLFAEALSRKAMGPKLSFHSIVSAAQEVFDHCVGSFSIVTLIAGYGLVAFRDRNGLRPLIHATQTNEDGKVSHLFSSESGVATFLDYPHFTEVKPGEVIAVTLDGQVSRAKVQEAPHRPCMFEWVYFAAPQSTIEHTPVYQARIQLGKKLAKSVKEQIKRGAISPDVVVPVPETSRISATALAEELGLPYREVLIKNRYITRTFILDTQDKREKAVQLKLAPVVSEIQGKNILLVDDSIVRGTTSRKLIEVLRQFGAKSVYFVSTAPKIEYPCFYGIDFPVQEELAGFGRSAEEVRNLIGSDALIYQEVEDLVSAIQPSESGRANAIKPCMACLNGDYPTSIESAAQLVRKRNEDREHVSANG